MKSDLLTIDSSVFISSINRADPYYKKSRRFFKKVADQKMEVVIPFLVVLEIDNVFQRWGKRKKWNSGVLLKDPKVEVVSLDKKFFRNFWLHARNFDLKTADNIVAVTAYHRRATLVSWDKRLVKATGELCDSQTPKQFLEAKVEKEG